MSSWGSPALSPMRGDSGVALPLKTLPTRQTGRCFGVSVTMLHVAPRPTGGKGEIATDLRFYELQGVRSLFLLCGSPGMVTGREEGTTGRTNGEE